MIVSTEQKRKVSFYDIILKIGRADFVKSNHQKYLKIFAFRRKIENLTEFREKNTDCFSIKDVT